MACTSTSDRSAGLGAVRIGLLVALAASCGRGGFGDVVPIGCPEGRGSEPWCSDPTDGGETPEPVVPWGEYVLGLGLPDCPAADNPALVVNTTADELDGGEGIADVAPAGAALSFREALWIAANRTGSDTILFDAAIFPTHTPGVIVIDPAKDFPVDMPDVCADGRGRGVVLDWMPDSSMSCSAPCTLNLGRNAMLLGMTLIHIPYEMSAPAGSRVAGCRFGTDGSASYPSGRPWMIDSAGGDIGPSNVFAGGTPVRVWGFDTRIHGNYFGRDPVTGVTLAVIDAAVDVRGAPAVVEANDFAGTAAWTFVIAAPLAAGTVIVRDNRLGARALGITAAARQGIGVLVRGGRVIIGPDNLMRGLQAAVRVEGTFPSVVRVTQNSIFDNDQGIVAAPNAPTPPIITSVAGTAVSGTCATDGIVELFSDATAQGELYLGSAPCSAGVFTWNGALPSGRNLTATLTDSTDSTSAFSAPAAVP